MVNRSLYFVSLVSTASFLIVKTVVSGKKSAMSTNYCTRTFFWWVRTCAPHLRFVQLSDWHFSLHLTPLQWPWHVRGRKFPTFDIWQSTEKFTGKGKNKSLFMFTFTLRTIYEVNGTAWYLKRCWPATDNNNFFQYCCSST